MEKLQEEQEEAAKITYYDFEPDKPSNGAFLHKLVDTAPETTSNNIDQGTVTKKKTKTRSNKLKNLERNLSITETTEGNKNPKLPNINEHYSDLSEVNLNEHRINKKKSEDKEIKAIKKARTKKLIALGVLKNNDSTSNGDRINSDLKDMVLGQFANLDERRDSNDFKLIKLDKNDPKYQDLLSQGNIDEPQESITVTISFIS